MELYRYDTARDANIFSLQVGVQFMCRVAVHECGNFYSIVWCVRIVDIIFLSFIMFRVYLLISTQVPGDWQ